MPRISLWNPKKTNDFNFADRVIGENFTAGGCAILTHMYTGPTTDAAGGTETDITTIQDLLFLSNNSRKYDPNVFELRGHYTPVDTQYDLSSFGIFLASDTLRVTFHYQTMIDTLGRKLIAGDVLEFPSMRDIPIGDTSKGINKYYVIQDAMWFAAGYGSKWMPHIWLIKAKQMTDSPEYTDIIESAATGETAGGVGSGIGVMSPGWASSVDASGNAASKHYTDTKNSLSMLCKYLNITDAVVKEAESNVFFDPVFFQTAHLYIEVNSDGYPELLSFMSGIHFILKGY